MDDSPPSLFDADETNTHPDFNGKSPLWKSDPSRQFLPLPLFLITQYALDASPSRTETLGESSNKIPFEAFSR